MRQLTKILSTIGPACARPDVLRRMVQAGASAFRINFSHGDYESKADQIALIRQIERELQTPIAILADLSGPKIRIGEVEGNGIKIVEGDRLRVTAEPQIGRRTDDGAVVSCSLPSLLPDVKTGETVLFDDGRLRCRVEEDRDDELICRVQIGGLLKSRKGMNLPDTRLKLSPITDKDRRDLDWIAGEDFDWIALSFVQRPQDIEELRILTYGHHLRIPLIAKIEKPMAVECIDEILEYADAAMVARGDLAVEMDFPQVPIAQKKIARACTIAAKPCIIATEMMESMIRSKTPTRAEVSDVANAVLDGADAVMLSAETAVGENPIDTVRMMSRTVTAVHEATELSPPLPPGEMPDLRIARAVRQMIGAHDIAVAAVYVETGNTVTSLSKMRLPCPILAIAGRVEMRRRVSLCRGVVAVECDETPRGLSHLLAMAETEAERLGLAARGDKLMLVSNQSPGVEWSVEGLVIHRLAAAAIDG